MGIVKGLAVIAGVVALLTVSELVVKLLEPFGALIAFGLFVGLPVAGILALRKAVK